MASSADLAMDVTEAAMIAALEAVREGDHITPERAEAIWLGLTRASARWVSMTFPEGMDGGFEVAYAKCLSQERQNRAREQSAGSA